MRKHCLQFLLRVKMAPRETENNAYAKFWGANTKSVMVCYGIFWGGQYSFITGGRGGGGNGEAGNIVQTSQRIWSPTSSRVMIGINESFLRVFCIFDERMRAITNLESS